MSAAEFGLAAFNAAVDGGIAAITNAKAHKRQKELMDYQENFNKENFGLQNVRQDYLNRHGFEIQAQAARNAGLSPLAMLAGSNFNSNVGSIGGTSAPSVTSNKPQAPDMLEAYMNAKQAELIDAEVRGKKADAEGKEIENQHTKDKDDAIRETLFTLYGKNGDGSFVVPTGKSVKRTLLTADGGKVEVEDPQNISVDSASVGTLDGILAVIGQNVELSEKQWKEIDLNIRKKVSEAQEKDPQVIDALVKKAIAEYNLIVANKDNTEAKTKQTTQATEIEGNTNIANLLHKATTKPSEVSLGEWIFLGVMAAGSVIGGHPEILLGKSKKDTSKPDTNNKSNNSSNNNKPTNSNKSKSKSVNKRTVPYRPNPFDN